MFAVGSTKEGDMAFNNFGGSIQIARRMAIIVPIAIAICGTGIWALIYAG